MQDINSLKIFSEKLINLINFVPEKVEVLSKTWYELTDELIQCDLKLESFVEHKFYLNKDSKEKLYIFWDHDSIDEDLKGFFTALIRVLKFAGTTDILVLDECFSLSQIEGEIVGISDHINFTSDNPLIGINEEEIGTRFPDMSHAYSDNYPDRFISVKKSVLAGVSNLNLSDRTMRLVEQSDAEVCNFSVMWMNILAVHSRIDFSAVCQISKTLIPSI